MLFKIDKPRRFEYKAKFYKSEEDRERPRIEFQSHRRHSQPQKGAILRMVLLLFFLIYLFITLQKAIDSSPTDAASKDDAIIVEEVIVVD